MDVPTGRRQQLGHPRYGVSGRPIGPDHVALVLSIGLALVAALILIATIVQIVHGSPEVVLSGNASQVLVAATSGLTGILGGYMGYRLGASRARLERPAGDPERRPYDWADTPPYGTERP